MKTKEIECCEASLKVLSVITETGKSDFTYDEGFAIAGIYWTTVAKEIGATQAGYFEYGELHITASGYLDEIRVQKLLLHERLIKEKEDRELAIREKNDNIEFGRKGYELAKKSFALGEKNSKWATRGVIFTSIVALGQLIQWIIMIIQWISNS
ncbi:MAG: hypothetical protein HDS35_00205 [Bacteroides sp.]|nr:hypothetical protein [Bacteroides sp.]